MTEPITDDEARQWRLRHVGFVGKLGPSGWCAGCTQDVPCPTRRLLDERERLREVLEAARHAVAMMDESDDPSRTARDYLDYSVRNAVLAALNAPQEATR